MITSSIALEQLTVKKFDDHRWIVNVPEGRNILLNEKAAGLLLILTNSENELEALENFQRQFHSNLSKGEFESLIHNTFKGLGILQGEESKFHKKPSYLSLKVPLLNARIAGLLANPLSFLFQPSVFWSVFTCVLILNGWVSISSFYGDFLSLTNVNFTLLTILVGASMLVHELGHIAACRQFGIRHGAVGFGFYFIFPIVYSEITQVWNATKPQRIIANAGGIYSELIYATILLLAFSITNLPLFLLAAISISIKAVTELNPFIRYDGYWLLSDITGTPNLMRKANEAMISFFSAKRLKSHFQSSLVDLNAQTPNILLLCYAFANTILLVGFLVYVLLNYRTDVIHFPALLLSLLQKAISLNLSWRDFPHGFLWVLGLYILTLKKAFQFILK